MTRHDILLWFLLLLCYALQLPAQVFPGKNWQQYEDPADAGLDLKKLDSLQNYFEKQGGTVFLVVIKGKVAISWGPPNRRFRQASTRKSYMNGIYGRYAEKIDLNKNLAQIGITERITLTEQEQKASIKDLMMTSSGIYLPSAYSLNQDQLPERGSAAPGEKWFYNNWDFNVLCTIFEKEVGKNPFEVFHREIAQPLGMEDFRMQDTHYYYEKDKSEHPAYLFKLSARDMARYGWLYLHRGKWKDQQILSSEWVEQSTRTQVKQLGPGFENRGGYGLLWWIGNPIKGHDHFSAAGAGGQRIIVFPEDDMVVVHLTNTYHRRNVSQNTINEMLALLLGAKSDEAKPNPRTKDLEVDELPQSTTAFEGWQLEEWAGDYNLDGLGPAKVFAENGQLFAELGIGTFSLLLQKDGRTILEDVLVEVDFQKAADQQKGKGTFELDDQKEVTRVVFYY